MDIENVTAPRGRQLNFYCSVFVPMLDLQSARDYAGQQASLSKSREELRLTSGEARRSSTRKQLNEAWRDASQTPGTGEIRLKINLYKRLKTSLQIRLDNPRSARNIPFCYKHNNIIQEALDVWDFSKKNPKKTRKELAQHFQISKNKVYVLKCLIRNLPPEFIQTFKDCEDKRLLRVLGREKLLGIIKLNSITKRREMINDLLQKSKNN